MIKGYQEVHAYLKVKMIFRQLDKVSIKSSSDLLLWVDMWLSKQNGFLSTFKSIKDSLTYDKSKYSRYKISITIINNVGTEYFIFSEYTLQQLKTLNNTTNNNVKLGIIYNSEFKDFVITTLNVKNEEVILF